MSLRKSGTYKPPPIDSLIDPGLASKKTVQVDKSGLGLDGKPSQSRRSLMSMFKNLLRTKVEESNVDVQDLCDLFNFRFNSPHSCFVKGMSIN